MSEPALQSGPGPLAGRLEFVSRHVVRGWARDEAHPDRAVGLVIRADGEVIATVLANRYRRDLQDAGLGDGRHAFELLAPHALLTAREIEVTREVDGAALPEGVARMAPATGFDAAVEEAIAGVLLATTAGSDADEDRALAFLAAQVDMILARRASRDADEAAREARRLHRRRWGESEADGAPAAAPATAPRALLLAAGFAKADAEGHGAALASDARALRALGWTVSIAGPPGAADPAAMARFAQAESLTAFGWPHYAGIEDLLRRQAGAFDLVWFDGPAMADLYLPLARSCQPHARLLMRLDEAAPGLGRDPDGPAVSPLVRVCALRADQVLTSSGAWTESLGRLIGAARVRLVPVVAGPAGSLPAARSPQAAAMSEACGQPR